MELQSRNMLKLFKWMSAPYTTIPLQNWKFNFFLVFRLSTHSENETNIKISLFYCAELSTVLSVIVNLNNYYNFNCHLQVQQHVRTFRSLQNKNKYCLLITLEHQHKCILMSSIFRNSKNLTGLNQVWHLTKCLF
jgi:hypothetical protein